MVFVRIFVEFRRLNVGIYVGRYWLYVGRGVKIMLSLMLLATIPTHAISKTLEVVPPDAADRLVWTKFSLYLLCDIIVYVGIVAGVLLLKPFVLELIEIIEEFVKKKTETNDEESLIQEIVPMVKVDYP